MGILETEGYALSFELQPLIYSESRYKIYNRVTNLLLFRDSTNKVFIISVSTLIFFSFVSFSTPTVETLL